ncbi:MAG: RsmD family RNA methyltransferase [Desulfurococcales archaeon]|nr:RsmD family RNA methyltransferase [Desulfurococcales archaeon]
MVVELYEFKPRPGVIVSPSEAKAILEGRASTVNLGLDRVNHLVYDGMWIELYTSSTSYRIPVEALERTVRDRYAWHIMGNTSARLVLARRGFKALEPTDVGPPTLWIDGIHMHRIKGTNPIRDARSKVRAARIGRGDKVLDICTGLGYTAIEALSSGARIVVTVEVDEDVIYLARSNPWSRALASDRIILIHGDAVEVVGELEPGFDKIIHDPPRFSSRTGALYSLEFYKNLYTLLRPGGTLFHYTGEPGRGRRINLPGSIASRLSRAGFIVVRYDKIAQGIVAYKPR